MARADTRPADVATYIEATPPLRRPAIEKLRRLCLDYLTGYEECIQYGMPSVDADVRDAFRAELAIARIGKACIRFRKPEPMDFAAVERMIRSTAESASLPC